MWYTPYHQDQDRIKEQKTYKKSSPVWLIIVPLMLLAAFVVSGFMGFAMLGTMLFLLAKRKHRQIMV